MEAEDSTCDPDLAKDAAGAFMVVDAEDPQARPGFNAFAARRTPVLPLTSALWGSAFPLEQAVTIASHIPLQWLPVPEAC